MRRFLLLFLIVSQLFFWWHLGSWIWAGQQIRLVYESVRTNPFALSQQQESIKKLTHWHRLVHQTGLGLYSLPYLRETHAVTGSGLSLLSTGSSLALPGEKLSACFSGKENCSEEDLTQAVTQITVLEGHLGEFEQHLESPRIEALARRFGRTTEILTLRKKIRESEPLFRLIRQFQPHLSSLLGFERQMTYIVLFQNNMELRPTGGFMGSYAKVTLERGTLQELNIQDIYVPDGQIKGYVKEPGAIRKYLFDNNHPGWRLRDSNWHPDFTRAAETMDWFFAEGGIEDVDGFVAINLLPIIDILKVTGPVSLPDFELVLSAENFYQEAQKHAELNFFPGSTQKTQFLSTAGRAILRVLLENPDRYVVRLLPVFQDHLEQKHILWASFEPALADTLARLNWDGALRKVHNTTESDYLFINEANLGINKTNCCIERNFQDEITTDDMGIVTHRLRLEFKNNNPATPKPPLQWGGGYRVYVRATVLKDSVYKELVIDGVKQPLTAVDFEESGEFLMIGFHQLIQGGLTGQALLTYQSGQAYEAGRPYLISLQKQSGVSEVPWTLTYNGILRQFNQDRDVLVSFTPEM